MLLDGQSVREDSLFNLLVPLGDPPRGANVPVHLLEVLAVVSWLALGLHDAVAPVVVDEVLPAPRSPVPLREPGVKRSLLVVLHLLFHSLLTHDE